MSRLGWLLASGGGGSPLERVILTPDFSSVAGWNASWGLSAGLPADIALSGLGWTGTAGPPIPAATEGMVVRQAFRLLGVAP